MARYIGWRLLALIPTVIGVVTVVFLLLRLIPGDPAEFILGDYATKENLARLRAQMGLDQPLYKQYAIFMTKWAQGDWGRSLISKQPALKEVLPSLFVLHSPCGIRRGDCISTGYSTRYRVGGAPKHALRLCGDGICPVWRFHAGLVDRPCFYFVVLLLSPAVSSDGAWGTR